MALRKTSDVIGSLLTRPSSRLVPEDPSKLSATQRRLQKYRNRPVEILKSSINRQESAYSEFSGGGGNDHGVKFASGGGEAGEVSEAEFNKRLQKMMAEAPGGVKIISGKRDPEKQKQLWADALKKYGDPEIADNWVARPGTSKHETGLAADLRWADDATKKWYHENASKYGLYFPMAHEPWHIQIDPKYAAQAPSLPQGNSFTGDPNLDFIVQAESSWRPDAQNPTSTAFGLGQMIIANREYYGGKLGYDPNTTDPMQQLHMMQEYIKDRYGSTAAAAEFKRKHGWY